MTLLSAAVIPALEVRSLRAGYGNGGDIVCGVSFSQKPETVLAIIGPNGSGKSTLIKTLAGLLKPREGTVMVTGKDVSRISAAKRVLAGMAYVPQEANVFRSLTVGENIQVTLDSLRGRPGVGRSRREEVFGLFPEIAGRRRLLAGNLSGGQRQMLAFACAMLANPEVILLDEPTAGLSPKFVIEIMAAVARMQELGATILLVEQNVMAALDVADEAIVLVGGSIRARKPASELRGNDLNALFLGQAA